MNFPYGEIVSHFPKYFVPPEVWPEYAYVESEFVPAICRREVVGLDPQGLRWSLWPLYIERYVSDRTPDLEQSKNGSLACNRIIRWNTFTRSDVPIGWHIFSKKPWRIDGFHVFDDGTDYRKNWSRIAKRYLRIWNEQHAEKYIIENISIQEFKYAYANSSVMKKAGAIGLSILDKKHALPQSRENMQLWGVRNRETGTVVAGVAVHYSPIFFQNTVHMCPFINAEGGRIRAMTALIDHWFTESRRRGSKILFMTHFWYPGQPKSWKGFSEYKSHFGLQYAAYPPELYRFVKGKLF